MNSLVYPRENTLFKIACIFSALFWVGIIIGTVGMALLFAPMAFLLYCFAQSAFISYVRGTGVQVSGEQLPEIYNRFLECCERLSMPQIPECYVMNGHGMLNALATRFLKRHYVVLFSDVVDAQADHPESLDFYIGHELGHIKRGHLKWGWFLGPAAILPLIGTAYSRAREYSCDLHGLACCDVPKDAAYGLAVLAAGERTWEKIDLRRYALQSDASTGFWMSYHELTSDYPWLTKRMRHLLAAANGTDPRFPGRHPLAWMLALFIPRAGGGLVGMMAAVAMIGIVAAIAIPNFVKFQQRAKMMPAAQLRQQVQSAADGYIAETQHMPPSLAAMGLPDDLSNTAVESVYIDGQSIVLDLSAEIQQLGGSHLVLTPYMEDGMLKWQCDGDLDPALLSQACADGAGMAAAMDPGAASEPAGTAHSASAAGQPPVNATTCSADFRATGAYHGLGEAGQRGLREACNAWKLEQLEAQMQGSS